MDRAASIEIVHATTPAQMEQVWSIRRRVFIEEQGVPEEIELDVDDARAFHVIALDGGAAVGCGRLVEHDGYVKIGRMATVRERRGDGIGRRVLEFLIGVARAKGYRRAILHAQLHAEGFYAKCGFAPVGEVFDEAGIPHREMTRDLDRADHAR